MMIVNLKVGKMKRQEVTIVNHYDILLFNHGGARAIKGLYGALSRWLDINIIMFTDNEYIQDRIQISDHIIVFPLMYTKTDYILCGDMNEEKHNLDKTVFVMCDYHNDADIIKRVATIAAASFAVIAEHVYTWRIIKRACPNKHLWYRAQNVEFDYKRKVVSQELFPVRYYDELFATENECCHEAELVLTISAEEKNALINCIN